MTRPSRRYVWSYSDNRETFTRDIERQEHDDRVHHTTGNYGHAWCSHFGALSGYRRRVLHHAAGWQRHRRGSDYVFLSEFAGAAEQRHRWRGADADLLRAV